MPWHKTLYLYIRLYICSNKIKKRGNTDLAVNIICWGTSRAKATWKTHSDEPFTPGLQLMVVFGRRHCPSPNQDDRSTFNSHVSCFIPSSLPRLTWSNTRSPLWLRLHPVFSNYHLLKASWVHSKPTGGNSICIALRQSQAQVLSC